MFHPLPLYIGLRYIYGQKLDGFGRFVSWLSMIGILLGSLGLIVVMSVMNGFENEMQKNILQFIPQVQITSDNQRIDLATTPQSGLPKLDNVTQITPLVTGDVVLQSANNITVSTLIGIDPHQFEPINNAIYLGDLSNLVEGQYNVILGRTLADMLKVSVGDQIRLMSTDASQITPVGRIPSQRLFTVSGLFSVNRDINQSLIYLNINDGARLLRYPSGTISSWRLFLDNPLDVDSVVRQPLPDNLQFQDWRLKRGELFQAIKMEKNVMGLLISLIVIVAAFNIITSLSLLVMEKQNEVAILKTQGLKKGSIMMIFIIQGASSGIIGTILGCLFGVTIAINLNAIMTALGLSLAGITLPSLVDPMQIVSIFIALLLLSLASTLYPAYRAANIQPAEALRYE